MRNPLSILLLLFSSHVLYPREFIVVLVLSPLSKYFETETSTQYGTSSGPSPKRALKVVVAESLLGATRFQLSSKTKSLLYH